MITLEQARELVSLLEAGQQDEANQVITTLAANNYNTLFNEIGKVTRVLYSGLSEFKLDPRLNQLTQQDLPDAQGRLNYVVSMTESAANRTMDAVDAAFPIADGLAQQIEAILPVWQKLFNREMELGEFKTLCIELDTFLKLTQQQSDQLRTQLTEILMSQDFQDLTGQIIRRVTGLVGEVEQHLITIMKSFGMPENEQPEEITREQAISAEGPIHDREKRSDVVQNQDDVDDLLSSLGF
ncbi:MAG: protein phosphatase CheZ [Plesiomonas sp.]|uniref:protein phosphatase CheZ n=2 Tax=Plesiomonas sp. TaxID=2486279 RepID=UPI003EE69560